MTIRVFVENDAGWRQTSRRVETRAKTLMFTATVAVHCLCIAPGQAAARDGQDRLHVSQEIVASRPDGFEATSVRPTTGSVDAAGISLFPNGRFSASNVTLRQLIASAHSVPASRVVGGPGWMDSDHWDVAATGLSGRGELALLALLRERFGLQLLRERREFPSFDLVLAREDGRLGPGLTPAAIDCTDPEVRAAAALILPDPTRPSGCSILQRPGRILAGGVRLPAIVGYLGVGRPVVDRTGLVEIFDVDLEWTPSAAVEGVSVFTALQEQLGLRLQPARTMLDVHIVERVERPQPD